MMNKLQENLEGGMDDSFGRKLLRASGYDTRQYAEAAGKIDGFVPAALAQIEGRELGLLRELEELLDENGRSYRAGNVFGAFLRKIKLLVYENYSEMIEGLNGAEVEKLAYVKIEYPTEIEVFERLMEMVSGEVEGDRLMAFEEYVQVVVTDVALREKLLAVWREYVVAYRAYKEKKL